MSVHRGKADIAVERTEAEMTHTGHRFTNEVGARRRRVVTSPGYEKSPISSVPNAMLATAALNC
jgi:hypothetical protein